MSTPTERTRLWRQRKQARALGLVAEPYSREPAGVSTRAHEDNPGWRAAAKCRGMNPVVFFGVEKIGCGGDHRTGGLHVPYAKAVCKDCPSIEPCLAFALACGDIDGVYGGTSQHERRRLRRQRGRG